jgi:hypothetical protein
MVLVKPFHVDLTPADLGEPFVALGGPDGRQISSRDKIMRCTDTLIGTESFAGRSTPVNTVTTTKLGDCNPDATFVWGFAKIDPSSWGSGTWMFNPDDRWFNVGGSYVQALLNTNYSSIGMAVYSIYATGGEVFIEEQLRMEGVTLSEYGQTASHPSFTLDYHLWCCAFV